MDGIDAVLATLEPAPRIIEAIQHPWPAPILTRLRAAASGTRLSASEFAQLDSDAGEVFAQAALAVSDRYDQPIRAIGSHGQTLAHGPDASPPFTLQIGNPAIIAERTGITTISDFRRRDIAAGGEGAPLVPAFHAATLASTQENRVILNIGGIANITVLPASANTPVAGFDTGPGNCLLDAWIRRTKGFPFDRSGTFAARGSVQADLLETCLQDPYFKRPAPKSTGTDYFSLDWLERRLESISSNPEDVQATLVALSAQSVADAIGESAPKCHRVLVCGGGVHNAVVMEALRARLPCAVDSTAAVGVDPDWVEALAFAWLARQTMEALPGNLPEVTGASGPRILGAIHPA